MAIRPSSGASSPAIRRSVVVLPAPVGPSSTTSSPSPTASDMRVAAATRPKRLLTSDRMTSAMDLPIQQRRAHRPAGGLVQQRQLLSPEAQPHPLVAAKPDIGGEPRPERAVGGGEG